MATENLPQQRHVTERSDGTFRRNVADELQNAQKQLRKILRNENNLQAAVEWKYEKSSKLSEFSDKPITQSLQLYYLTELLASTTAAIAITSSNSRPSKDSEIRVLHNCTHEKHVLSTAGNVASASEGPPSYLRDFEHHALHPEEDDVKFKASSDDGYPPSNHGALRKGHYVKGSRTSVDFTGHGKFQAKFDDGHPPLNHGCSEKGSYDTASEKKDVDYADEEAAREFMASLFNQRPATKTNDNATESFGVDDNPTRPVDDPDHGKFKAKLDNGNPPSNQGCSQKESYDTASEKNVDYADEGAARNVLASLFDHLLSTKTSDCSTELFGVDHNPTRLVDRPDHGKFKAKFDNGHPLSSHGCSQKESYDTASEKNVDYADKEAARKFATELFGVDNNPTRLVDRPDPSNLMGKYKSHIFTDMEAHGVSKCLLRLLPFYSSTEQINFVLERSCCVWVVRQGEMSDENFMINLTRLPPYVQRYVMMRSQALRYRSFECLSQEWRRRCNIDNGTTITDVVSRGFYFLGSEDEMHCCACGHSSRLSEDHRQWQHQCIASPMLDGALQRTVSENDFAVGTGYDSGSSSTESTSGATPVEAVDYESTPGSPTTEAASFQRGLTAGTWGQADGAGNSHVSSSLLSAAQAICSTTSFSEDAALRAMPPMPSFNSFRNGDIMTPALENVDSQNRGNPVVQELVGDADRPVIVEDGGDSSATQCQDGRTNYERQSDDEV